jgi:hypothetical protein
LSRLLGALFVYSSTVDGFLENRKALCRKVSENNKKRQILDDCRLFLFFPKTEFAEGEGTGCPEASMHRRR